MVGRGTHIYSGEISRDLFWEGEPEMHPQEVRVRPKELTYVEVLARIWSCFRIAGVQGPVAWGLCFSGLEKQGGKAEVR